MSGPVSPPLRVQTENGTVSGRPINTIKVTNGTLTISGSTASVVTGAGGGGGSGTVTSVGLTQTGSALDITGSPVTASGTIDIAGAGNSSQVILGDLSLGTLTSGTVTGVTGTAPISSSGGTAPAISITQSDATTNGYLSSTDWNTFNDKGSGTITGSATNTQVSYGAATANEITSNANLTFDGTNLSVGGYVEVGTKVTTPSGDNLELIPGGTSSGSIVIADGLDGQISLNPSGTGTVKLDGVELDNSNIATGYVLKASSTTVAGWAAESGGGGGTVTGVTGTAPISSSGGTAPAISIAQSDATTNGYLSSTDWTTFNNKQDALTLTTTGSSGAATLVGSTLNIPQYSGGGGGIGGSGTIGTVPVFVTDTTTLGDSRLVQSGSTEMIYSASSGAAFTVKSNDGNEPNFKMLTSASTGLRFELTNADSITLKKVGTNTLRFRSDGTAFTIFNNTSSTDGIFSATYSTGAIKINNAYTLPTAVPTVNGQVLTGQTDGSTAWAASGGGGSPAGSNTEVQFNNSGAFGASSILTFDGTYLSPNLVKLADGSNTGSFPYAVGFASDDDTGMYRSDTNQIAFSTGGGQVLTFGGFPKRVLLGEHTGTTATSLSTYGAQDIVISTNQTTDSGTITITNGVNGDISLTPNGTGAVEISGAYKLPTAVPTVNGQVLTGQTDGSTAWATSGGGVTFPLEGSDGTKTVPTYSFSNATNMGMYKASGMVALRLAVGGSDVLEIQKDGAATEFRVGDGGEARITSNGSYDLLLQTDNGSNSGTIKINQGANSNIDITPNGDGYILLDNLKWPIADGTNGQVLTTDGTGGLTFQSGGSSSDYGVFFGSDQSYFQASYDQWQISNMVPFQVIGENATNIATQYSQAYKPFIAPKTGEVTELIIRIATLNGSALNGFVSIYNSNSDGMPSTLIGYATFDLNSATGEISQNTFSTAINLTKGSGYYLSWSDSQGSAVARTYRVQTHKPGTDNATSHFTYCNQVDNLNSEFIVNFSTSTTPDSPAGTSNYNSSAYGFPTINMVM